MSSKDRDTIFAGLAGVGGGVIGLAVGWIIGYILGIKKSEVIDDIFKSNSEPETIELNRDEYTVN